MKVLLKLTLILSVLAAMTAVLSGSSSTGKPRIASFFSIEGAIAGEHGGGGP
jgi:hypothetical protein